MRMSNSNGNLLIGEFNCCEGPLVDWRSELFLCTPAIEGFLRVAISSIIWKNAVSSLNKAAALKSTFDRSREIPLWGCLSIFNGDAVYHEEPADALSVKYRA